MPRGTCRRLLVLGLFVVAPLAALLLAVAPWGDYPLNDDWQYARVAKRLAETGRLVVDVPVAPSLVAQTVVATPVLSLLGFSHRWLRLLTLTLGVLMLWGLDSLLAVAGVGVAIRVMAFLTTLFNPLFMNLSLSYMSEIYGFAPAVVGAVVWFEGRRLSQGAEGGPLLRWPASCLAAALVAWGFWSRQFAAVVFPALLVATILANAGKGGRARLTATLPHLAAGLVLFLTATALYYPWASRTGNLQARFTQPLRSLTTFDAATWLLMAGAALFYLTAFLLPLLLMVRWRDVLRGQGAWLALIPVGLGLFTIWKFGRLPVSEASVYDFWHRRFPFLGNLIHDAGLGPVTLADVFFRGRDSARWGREAWMVIQTVILASTVLWVAHAIRAVRLWRSREGGGLREEIGLFAFLWAMGSLALTLQAYQMRIFDRYYLPTFLGLVTTLALAARRDEPQSGAAGRLALFLLGFLPIAWFGTAGMHDYFRWNDARWEAVNGLRSSGISPTVIQGGYEVNGWLVADDYRAGRAPQGCIGECGCSVKWADWNCLDDSYMVAMGAVEGYTVLETRPVDYWLAEGPPILVLKRWQGREEGGGEGAVPR